MPRIRLQGRSRHILRCVCALGMVSVGVLSRRFMGKPLAREWSSDMEIGNLFWRHQFNHAFALGDFAEARDYFDSLQTLTDEVFAVEIEASKPGEPKGDWYVPKTLKCTATMLYFHGGGYAFYAAVTRRLIEALAGTLGIKIFALDYRLTPEHSHPAQLEDAISAYRFLLSLGGVSDQLIVAGDSAGGHLVLMSLLALRDAGLPQPAVAIGICPWTDIGRRGASQFGNDLYDLVQGYMTLKFGEWLKGTSGLTDAQLSPISHNFRGLAPLYLQGGGKEILIDMIRDFAVTVRDQGADVTLMGAYDARLSGKWRHASRKQGGLGAPRRGHSLLYGSESENEISGQFKNPGEHE